LLIIKLFNYEKSFNFALLIGALGTLFGTTSCKKDWVCNCTVDGDSEDIDTYPDTKKADAKKLCDAYETLLKAEYGDASCKLK